MPYICPQLADVGITTVPKLKPCPTSACSWQMWASRLFPNETVPYICLQLADVGIPTACYFSYMPSGLRRLHQSRQTHFVTFSCYHRLPLLRATAARNIFLDCLERTRRLYQLRVYGYVVMPEHVHLLLSEPEEGLLSTAIQSLKVASSRRTARLRPPTHPRLWQRRYFDHNVRSVESFETLLRYTHRNPVKRGLVAKPEDWRWSSFRHYAMAEVEVVEIESQWTADRRIGKVPNLLELRSDVPTSANDGQM